MISVYLDIRMYTSMHIFRTDSSHNVMSAGYSHISCLPIKSVRIAYQSVHNGNQGGRGTSHAPAGMIADVICDIVHFASDNDPSIVFMVVFRNFFDREVPRLLNGSKLCHDTTKG
jgi:hypothetical protein